MNNNQFPLFSVIIPQKDRAEYLIHTLRTCMMQDYPNFQVIVSDDCSVDNSVEVAKNLASIDSRIKVFAHTSHLGMRDNFEFALNQVKEGYVMALGGDDGLTPGSIWRMYNILKDTGKELLAWSPANFEYPAKEGDPHNIFLVKRKRNNSIKVIKSSDFLNTIAKTFNYQVDECPMFYVKGVASMELVNRVKSRTSDGCFYYCPTPDGFSGVVLAGEVEDYAYTNEPLSIIGTTTKSQGKNYMRTDAKSREEAQQFFNDNIRRTMHKDLASQPYSPLQTLMTADYLLTAKDLPCWPGKFEDISFEELLRVTFHRLETHQIRNEVLIRELKILREIARQHELEQLFDELMKSTKRKVVRVDHLYGFVITNSIRFDGSEIGINNIFDAAIATPFVYSFYNQFSFKSFWGLLKNEFKVILRQRKYTVESLPEID